MNELYDIDQGIDSLSVDIGHKLGEIQSQIIALNKRIVKLECPRDNSLDNAVVVWYSDSFSGAGSNSSGDAPTTDTSTTALLALCNAFEDTGLTVRRCGDQLEAISSARELQELGQLRCVIVGGSEKPAVCGLDCINPHHGNCVVCGGLWQTHAPSHMCPGGARGAWRKVGISNTLNPTAPNIVSSLMIPNKKTTEKTKPVQLPSSRIAVYAAQLEIKEEERLFFWNLGCGIIDEAVPLLTWALMLPPEPVENRLLAEHLDELDLDSLKSHLRNRLCDIDRENAATVRDGETVDQR